MDFSARNLLLMHHARLKRGAFYEKCGYIGYIMPTGRIFIRKRFGADGGFSCRGGIKEER